jgi:hypothetical protein
MSQASTQGPAPLAIDLIPEIPSWYYKPPERNQKGGFSNFIVRKPGDFERICFQATAQEGEPRCVAPFGISKPYDPAKEGDSNKRNFELNMHSENLRKFLQALDENTIRQAIANYDTWFGGDDKKRKKQLTEADIRGMYRPLIQEGDSEKKYADIFRTKVVISGDNMLRVFVYKGMVNGHPVCVEGRLSDVTQFVECVPIIEVVGMWFMSKQFGLSLTTTDVVIFPKLKRPPGLFNFGGKIPQVVAQNAAEAKQEHDDMDIVPSEEARSGGNRVVPVSFAESSDIVVEREQEEIGHDD